MSKTTPARWWRNDDTRYQSRPPYRAPHTPIINIEVFFTVSPEEMVKFKTAQQEFRDQMMELCRVPLELLK